jgi:hypothetical protein
LGNLVQAELFQTAFLKCYLQIANDKQFKVRKATYRAVLIAALTYPLGIGGLSFSQVALRYFYG